MEIELFEIRNHLFSHPPFRNLPKTIVDGLVAHVQVAYFKAGTPILEKGQTAEFLHVIRKGAVEICRSSGELMTRMGEGECFGQFALMRNKRVRYPARAMEDTLVYLIPDRQFQELYNRFDRFADFMEEDRGARLQTAVEKTGHGGQAGRNPLMFAKLRDLLHGEIITADAGVSIREAARIMTRNRVSSLVLLSGEGENLSIAGLVTDRDLRKRAVAKGLYLESPVSVIMSKNIITHEAGDFAFEAMLTMMRYNLHHIPVLDKGRPMGVITVSDLIQYASHGSIFIVGDIFRRRTVAGLSAIAATIPQILAQLVNEDANARTIGTALSRIGISISRRLLQLGEKQLGPPPVPYCLLSLGAMARNELTLVTDQDNAFVLDDGFDPKIHDKYFSDLAAFLSDGLAQCGYPYCTGGIMATNPQWRQPLSVWKSYFRDWIEQPDPQALLHASIFFDLKGIFGETGFAGELQQLICEKARGNPRFLTCLARNALMRTPPLGFFRTFMVEPDGAHKDTFNLKRRGTAPISDIARVHALAMGTKETNTANRLEAVKKTDLLSEGVGDDLLDALEFISMVRIRHQARQAENGEAPDNNVSPGALSSFERRHLKDAFQVAAQAQAFLKYRYNAPRNTAGGKAPAL